MRDETPQITGAAQYDRPTQCQWVGGPERAFSGQFMARRRPERQVTARRMSDCDHAVQVEVVIRGQRTQVVYRESGVQKSPRPSAALLVHTTVLDVPGRDALVPQGIGQRIRVALGPRRSTASIRRAGPRPPDEDLAPSADAIPRTGKALVRKTIGNPAGLLGSALTTSGVTKGWLSEVNLSVMME